MGWRDRFIMKMMGNKLVIKIFSNPTVLKIMMWEAQVIMSIISVFKRKKEATD